MNKCFAVLAISKATKTVILNRSEFILDEETAKTVAKNLQDQGFNTIIRDLTTGKIIKG